MERKLSTIFASDVVGYSKMMGNNEEKTLETLGERREVIDSAIAEHNGIIFGSAGDSVIAEFGSPVKATECAVQIQGKMKTMNEDIPVDQQMIFRIGINIFHYRSVLKGIGSDGKSIGHNTYYTNIHNYL